MALARADGEPAGTVGLLVDRRLASSACSSARSPIPGCRWRCSPGWTRSRGLGDSARVAQAVSERVPTLMRLPNGGTWRVVSVHALTSRSLRLGTLGARRDGRAASSPSACCVSSSGPSMSPSVRAELERLYSDVKRANQAKSEFLANVSHELRTPLNAIVGFVELLRDGFYGDLSPRQVPPVDRIAASATHLRHLVDQVLDIAKIAAGRLEVHAETIVLRPVRAERRERAGVAREREGTRVLDHGRRVAAARAHRSDAPATDPDQPDRQRREVHAGGHGERARAPRRSAASGERASVATPGTPRRAARRWARARCWRGHRGAAPGSRCRSSTAASASRPPTWSASSTSSSR